LAGNDEGKIPTSRTNILHNLARPTANCMEQSARDEIALADESSFEYRGATKI
jgi:hypothetical protein